MTSHVKNKREADSDFSFGTRELRQAKISQALSLVEAPRKSEKPQGFDPYNTSGSFDRKKHWARVGKR